MTAAAKYSNLPIVMEVSPASASVVQAQDACPMSVIQRPYGNMSIEKQVILRIMIESSKIFKVNSFG
ncbi:MAG: hypothetical protein GC191_06145 [Azospirillum sp.]|nr:hypothetical protein [Azospirillum sp.]